MPTVYVNDQPVQLGDHERLNVIQAAAKANVEIPHYCWHPALSVVASCRMCLVEVGEKKPDGSILMQPRVVPGCQTPAKDGTVIVTNSKKVKDAQAATLEYLLLNHPLDCPVCDQAGECFLQDYSYRFGHAQSRLKDDKLQKPDKDHIGDQIALFTDRCVMCSRCVRFTREISGTAELHIIHRGDHAEIDIFPEEPCNNKLAGNVVDICPVGALCSKDFLYKQRVWFLKDSPSVCPGCSTGCSIEVDQNKNIVYRLKPRFNPQAQGHFMCDEGRFGYKYINSTERFQTPMVRIGKDLVPIGWDGLLHKMKRELQEAVPGGLMVLLSPWLTVEEAYLAALFFKGLSNQVTLALGPVPVVGADDHYPKGPRGEAPKDAKEIKFTIRAEKCPNYRGVAEIVKHVQGEVMTFEQALKQVDGGKVKGLFIAASSPSAWITEAEARLLEKLSLLMVMDLLPSPASAKAKYVLPAGSFAEKDGTFVNHAYLAQAIVRAVQSPGEVRTEGRVFMEWLERRGLFHAATIRQELAQKVPAFAALGAGDLGALGVFLQSQREPAVSAGPSASATAPKAKTQA